MPEIIQRDRPQPPRMPNILPRQQQAQPASQPAQSPQGQTMPALTQAPMPAAISAAAASPAPGAKGVPDLVSVARGQVGWEEQKNAADIINFFKTNGVKNVDPRVTAWCAAYVDAVLGAGGAEQRKSLRAADFLTYGDESKTPGAGNVVVFKPLAAGSSGHVGIVTGIEGDRVRYIAGNDGNAVSEDTLPLSKVAGFRLPRALGGGDGTNAFGGLPAQSGVSATDTPMTLPDLSPSPAVPASPAEVVAPATDMPALGGFDFGKAIAGLAGSFNQPQPSQMAQKPAMPAIRQVTRPVQVADRSSDTPKKASLNAIFGV